MFFSGRIKIGVLNVRNRLQLADREDGEMTEHIIGTHLKDLTQIYNQHVTIRGSLTLINVSVSSIHDNFFSPPLDFNVKEETNTIPAKDEAVIVVAGIPFQLANVSQDYWMKSVDQVSGLIIHGSISNCKTFILIDLLFSFEFRILVMLISINRLAYLKLQRTS